MRKDVDILGGLALRYQFPERALNKAQDERVYIVYDGFCLGCRCLFLHPCKGPNRKTTSFIRQDRTYVCFTLFKDSQSLSSSGHIVPFLICNVRMLIAWNPPFMNEHRGVMLSSTYANVTQAIYPYPSAQSSPYSRSL